MGFCLVDLERIETNGPGSARYSVSGNNFCGQGEPSASSVVMGVSAGWRDVYSRSLAFQWVDVSDGVIAETDEANPPALATGAAVVPGFRATNVEAPAARGSRQVQLAAANVGAIPR